jgi:putative glutamine amidotransferase
MAKKTKKRPIICLPANIFDYNGLPAHVVRDTYIRAIVELMGGLPLIIPALPKGFDFAEIARRVDGVLLTGSPSHVAPAKYGKKQVFDDDELDLARDATTLPLIKAAIRMNKPIMAICRGFQELNVVLGGTLHQRIHEIPGKQDHRAVKGKPLKDLYEMEAHAVTLQKGGVLEKMKLPKTFRVNTLHQQGIDRLGRGLKVEAVAEDGIIEAISMPGKKFVVGTQWHPEGDWHRNKASRRILEAFGKVVGG